jgi:hypothetical protein
MEIKEIVSYYLNNETNILEVSFRTIEDSEDVLRNDNIDFSIAEDYGFDLVTEAFDFFNDNFDDDDFELDEDIDTELDEDELTSFLNEYYTVNPEKLPVAEIY